LNMQSHAMPLEYQHSNGRMCDGEVPDVDRHMTMAMHLSPFATLIGLGPLALVIPLILWLVRKDESVFADDHGREILNAIISFFVLHLILLITLIGVILWPVLWIVAIVSLIRGAIAASRGEYFRYPMTFRFL
jgi:uncharacterized Tic20 family protein